MAHVLHRLQSIQGEGIQQIWTLYLHMVSIEAWALTFKSSLWRTSSPLRCSENSDEEEVLTVQRFINLLLWLQFECVCVCPCLPLRVSCMFSQAGDWYVWLFASLDGCHVLLIAVLGDLYPFTYFSTLSFLPVGFSFFGLLVWARVPGPDTDEAFEWRIFFFSLGLKILRPIRTVSREVLSVIQTAVKTWIFFNFPSLEKIRTRL